MAGYADFSFTEIWARIGGVADSALAKSSLAPRGVVVDLPDEERDALQSLVSPMVADLEALRLQTLETVDKRARLLVPLAGGAAFIALLLGGQGLVSALIFGALAAVAGWFLAMGHRASKYQAAVKSRIAPVTTGLLAGFDHGVEPETDLARVRDWQLFPKLQSARTLDRVAGVKNGFAVRLSEMQVGYSSSAKLDMIDHTLSFAVFEVQVASDGIGAIALTPNDAPPRLLAEQAKSDGLRATLTGDADFDRVYRVRVNPPDALAALTPDLRSAILGLAVEAPAGRPYVVLTPEYLVVLFPTLHADLAFHVPPYWVPIDAQALVAQFASDLAARTKLLNAVLNLPFPQARE